jgi:hypothetical protein
MCFSASVSFAAAAVTGAAGAVALARTRSARDVPLAATPLLFAVHQAIEGAVWLRLPGGSGPDGWTFAFLLVATVVWPVYAPFAAWRAEPDPRRRRLMSVFVAIGAGVAAVMAARIVGYPHAAAIADGHVAYATGVPARNVVILFYLAATAPPLLLSSRPGVVAFGVLVLVGYAVAYLAYAAAFVSVWCFFAAAASVAVAWEIERARRVMTAATGTRDTP